MNEFKFQITTFLLVALLAFGGYWAFTSLDRGVTYSKNETVATLSDTDGNQADVIIPPVVTIVNEDPDTGDQNEGTVEGGPDEEPTDDPVEVSADKQDLLNRLEGLIEDNIFMKEGSRGTRVGTVQEFLNLYLDTQSTADNQYGPGTLARVKEFQSAEGLGADGLAGPATYQKMIDVLGSL